MTGRRAAILRISINAFSTSPDVRSTFAKAAEDRRLHNSRVELFEGDLPQAIARYREVPTPQLIVVETALGGDALFGALDQLAENCDAGTRVLLVGHQNDITQYRALIARGISDYLLPPLSIGGLIEAAERIFHDPDAPQLAPVYAFFGAEGGVGASTVAANVSWAMGAVLDADVTLMDLDLCFGTSAFSFNLEVTQGVEDILSAPGRIDEQLYERLLLQYSNRISILGSRASLLSDAQLDPESLAEALHFVRQQTGHVILDVPHIWTDWVRQTLVEADQTVVVSTLELSALRDVKNIVDYLNQQRGEASKVKTVLNHRWLSRKVEVPAKEFTDVVGAAPSSVVPHDPALFGQAANTGQPIGELNRKHAATQVHISLASELLGWQAANGTRKKGLGLLGLFRHASKS